MAVKETVNIDVKVESAKTLGQLEDGLARVNDELKETEIGSKRFKELTKDAQAFNREINAVNQAVEGLTLEKKVEMGQAAVLGLAGSLEATVGTLGLFGIESEAFGKFEEKAVSALTAARGFIDLSEGFGKLTVMIKNAGIAQKAYNVAVAAGNKIMKLLNITMKANPIGVLITALTVVGGLIFAFRDKILDLIKSALGPFSGIIDKLVGAFTSLGEALGLVDDEQTKQLKENIKAQEKAIRLAQARGENTLAMEKKLLQDQAKLLEEGTEEYEKNLEEQEIIDIKMKQEQEARDKEASDKRIAENKRVAEEKKKQEETYLNELQKINDQLLDQAAKTEEEKLQLTLDRRLRDIDNLEITEEQKADLKLKAQEKYNNDLNDLLDKQATENEQKERARQQLIDDLDLQLKFARAESAEEFLQAETDRINADFDKRREDAGNNTAALIKIEALRFEALKKLNADYVRGVELSEQAMLDMKKQVQAATIDNFQQAAMTLFEDNKALASAMVLVDAAQAAVGIIDTANSSPASIFTSIPYQISQFALLAATTIKSLQTINSSSPSGGGGGGSFTPPAGAAPVGPDLGRIQDIRLEAPVTAEAPAVRAYVLTGDINSSQEADARLSKRRSLG